MAFGALSSLGAGSGILTYDVIDKLKNADKATNIDPFARRLKNTQSKEGALNDLMTQLSLFKSSFSDFKNGEIFQQRLSDVSGDSVSARAMSGVKAQDIEIDVKNLATNDIYQSKSFLSKTETINTTGKDQTITLNYGGNSQEFKIKTGDTLTDLKEKINNSSSGVTASIIDTGDKDHPYKLILKGSKTGEDNTIKLDYSNISDLGFNATTYQSKDFEADTDIINKTQETQKFQIAINGTTYSMDLEANATVKDMIEKINNGELKDKDDNTLSLKAKFENNKITFDNLSAIGDIKFIDTGLETNFEDNTTENANKVQEAKNSKFIYNGIEIERNENKIEDLIVGLTIDLKTTGKSNIHIKQDNGSISQELKDFVSGFNSLVSKIQDLTKYDEKTKIAGVFQDEGSVKNITSDMSKIIFGGFIGDTITKKDRNGNDYSEHINLNASDFGFSMNRTGFLDFDASKVEDMLKNSPDKIEEFFSDDENGVFTKVLNYVDTLTKGKDSKLELLSQQYKKEEKSFQKTIEEATKSIEAKYQTMAAQFASYDNMINQYNIQSQSIQQSIQAMIAAKK